MLAMRAGCDGLGRIHAQGADTSQSAVSFGTRDPAVRLCSTGSTALFLARQAIEGGLAECVLALGFEKMAKGALGAKYV